jgi:hypothetical protein
MDYTIFFSGSDTRSDGYCSMCGFSMPAVHVAGSIAGLQGVLAPERAAATAWAGLKTEEQRLCAERVVDFVVERVTGFGLRLEVGIVEVDDDDPDFPEEMAIRLLEEALIRRGDDGNWSVLCQDRRLPGPIRRADLSGSSVRIDRIEPAGSDDLVCCQVADLFAAAAAFSRSRANRYLTWALAMGDTDISLGTERGLRISEEEHQKFILLRHLNRKCRSLDLGVSLISCGFLWTPNPENPVNFRHFGPRPGAGAS